MPFIEILAPPRRAADRAAAARRVTAALAAAFDITEDIISIYFSDVPPAAYAHAGVLGTPEAGQRLFVKIHAFRRRAEQRRRAASAITAELCAIYGAAPADIAVYFLEREPDEVAHAGRLAGDETQ